MRVLWDSYRKRFWILAQARNDAAAYGTKKVPSTPAEKLHRRDKIFAAFSKDADPRDGWTYWAWDAEAGNGSCNSETLVTTQPAGCVADYLPGDGADYFTIGVSEHALTETEFVGDTQVPNHNWDEVNVMRADKMVAGTCKQHCGWAYWKIPPPDGSGGVMTGTSPAQQHGPSPDDRQYIAGGSGTATLDVFDFQPGQDQPWPPPLSGQAIAANALRGSPPIEQPVAPNGENATPASVNLGKNIPGHQIIRAVYRDGQLYALKPDCRFWGGQNACTPAIHFWRLDPSTGKVTIDRVFGKNGPGDGPNDIVGYGWPMMDVNKDGTMAIGYQRAGPTVFPEARYSLLFAANSDISPSNVLAPGTYPFGAPLAGGETDDAQVVARLDFTGAAVDPYDDTAVWLMQAYAYRYGPGDGEYQPIVARVLGDGVADATVPFGSVKLSAQGGKPAKQLRPGARLSLTGRVDNLGDGAARAVSLRALLMPGGARSSRPTSYTLGETSLGVLRAGRVARFRLAGKVPPRTRRGRYRVQLVVSTPSRQFDARNDATTVSTVWIG
jgi:hypothetical protein